MNSTNKQPLRRDTRVFISAVSRELGSTRLLVKKGLEDNDYHAVEQSSFPPDYRDLVEKLRERILSCDAVVHIVGHCFGAEPKQPPDGIARRSYTQLEYDLAVELGKPVYLFLIAPGFAVDPHDEEDAPRQRLQQEHRQRLSESEREYTTVYSADQLDQKIRSLQLRVEALREELTAVDHQVVTTGRHLIRGLVGLAALALISLGIGLYVMRQQQSSLGNELQQVGDGLAQLDEKLAQVPPDSDTDPDAMEGILKRQIRKLTDERISEARRSGSDWRVIDSLTKQRDVSLRDIDRVFRTLRAGRTGEPNPTLTEAGRVLTTRGVDEAIEYLKAKLPEINKRISTMRDENRDPSRDDIESLWFLASLYRTNFDWDKAIAVAELCCEAAPNWYRTQRELGRTLLSVSQRDRAASHLETAMTLAETDEQRYEVAGDLGMCRLQQTQYDSAESLFREARASAKRSFGEGSAELALAIGNMAGLFQETDRLMEAEISFRQALAIEEAQAGKELTEIAVRVGNLAGLYEKIDRFEWAEPLLWRAIELDRFDPEVRYGDAKNLPHALHLNNLGLILKDQNRFQPAETLIRHALAMVEDVLSPYHPEAATRLSNLSLVCNATARPEQAEGLIRRALAIDEKANKPNHPDVARDLNNLSLLLGETQRKPEAELLMLRAFQIELANGGASSFNTAIKLGNLAWRFAQTQRYVLAETLVKHAIEIDEAVQGTEHSSVAIDLTSLAVVLEATGRVEEAADIMRHVRDIDLVLASRSGHVDSDAANHLNIYRQLLQALGVAADKIDQQVNNLSHKSPLPEIMPHINEKLGKAPPLDEVLKGLTAGDESTGRQSPIQSLSLDEPITPLLDELIGPSPLDLPIEQPVAPLLNDLIGPLAPLEDALAQLKQQYEDQKNGGIWSVPIGDPITPELNRLIGPLPDRAID